MSELTVLVVSCDKYSDLWPYFFRFLDVHWPDCPFPICLGSNHRTWPGGRVRMVNVGDDRTWAQNVRAMLQQIDSPRVILLLEDFFLVQDVSTPLLQTALRIARSERADCLRLAVSERGSVVDPASVRDCGGVGVGVFPAGAPYRISTQAAIWSRSTLLALLDDAYSAWDFEHIGTMVAERLDLRILGVDRPLLKYRHAVERGRWLPQGVENCRRIGLEIDFSKRPALTAAEMDALLKRGRDLRTRVLRTVFPPALLRWRQRMKAGGAVSGALTRTRQRMGDGCEG